MRHKHYTPPADQPQMSFSDPHYLDKLDAALAPAFAAIPTLTYKPGSVPRAQEPPSVPVDTSEAAALGMMGKTGRIAANVLSFIRARGPRGATLREIAHALRLNENTARPRAWELCGNVPAGRRPRSPLIVMTEEKREGMRVYKAVGI